MPICSRLSAIALGMSCVILLRNLESVFGFGGETYELSYCDDKNLPLFSYDSIGNKTLIKVNRNHYFYSNDLKFRLSIISIVANLRRNYASEDLIDDVQRVFDPPALLRVNYPQHQNEAN